jgi:hypothetical protein
MRTRIPGPNIWKGPVARAFQTGFDFGVLICLFINPLGSTIIVVIRTGDSVVVAADSTRTSPTGQTIDDSTCKIKAIGNDHFLASAGATRSLALIEPELVSAGLSDTDAIAEALERHLMPLLRILSQDILFHPDPGMTQYARYAKGGSLMSFVVVGKTRANHVGWAMRDFSVWSPLSRSEGGRSDTIRNSCPGNCPTPQIILSGSYDEALRRAPDLFSRKSASVVAEELVSIQMRADPANVGGQISVLVIDSNGHKWIKPGACTIR